MSLTSSGLFVIDIGERAAGEIKATLLIDQNNLILKGHFPGQPVVPGACMVQLIKDVLEDALGLQLQMKAAANIKFISMLTPGAHHGLALFISYKILDDGCISASAKITGGDMVCFKMQAVYLEV